MQGRGVVTPLGELELEIAKERRPLGENDKLLPLLQGSVALLQLPSVERIRQRQQCTAGTGIVVDVAGQRRRQGFQCALRGGVEPVILVWMLGIQAVVHFTLSGIHRDPHNLNLNRLDCGQREPTVTE